MKNKYIFLLLLCNILFAQISISDINKLSNQQLDAIKAELQTANQISNENAIEETPNLPTVEIASEDRLGGSEFFGYNYFKKDLSFFDNTPTPAEYKLGPGD